MRNDTKCVLAVIAYVSVGYATFAWTAADPVFTTHCVLRVEPEKNCSRMDNAIPGLLFGMVWPMYWPLHGLIKYRQANR